MEILAIISELLNSQRIDHPISSYLAMVNRGINRELYQVTSGQ